MARFLKSREKLVGQAPGTLTFIGRKKMEKTRLRLICYNNNEVIEEEATDIDALLKQLKDDHVNWINIDGLHDEDVILKIGERFNLSPLVLEDIVNTDQRPKMVEEADYVVVFLKQLWFDDVEERIFADQISIVLGKNYVITFQEKVGEFFNPIRDRLRQNIGKLRNSKADYLFYRIIDTLADMYMLCMGRIGELVEGNEAKILADVKKESLEDIYSLKKEISFIRKSVRPTKEVTKLLRTSDTDLILEPTWPYFNDVDELLTDTLESVELYYTMISDQLNIYNTNLSNRANDVMKVLTIFAAIFIPLTFIAGIYGTNFDYLPELHYKYSYFIMLGIMLLVAVIMLIYFRRKKWF